MKRIIKTEKSPAAIGPYSQAVQADNFLFISGQLGLDEKTGDFAGVSVADQMVKAMENIGGILAEAGMGYENLVKVTVLLGDIKDFARINEIYAGFFSSDFPARAAFQAAGLPKGALVEIDAIAFKG